MDDPYWPATSDKAAHASSEIELWSQNKMPNLRGPHRTAESRLIRSRWPKLLADLLVLLYPAIHKSIPSVTSLNAQQACVALGKVVWHTGRTVEMLSDWRVCCEQVPLIQRIEEGLDRLQALCVRVDKQRLTEWWI